MLRSASDTPSPQFRIVAEVVLSEAGLAEEYRDMMEAHNRYGCILENPIKLTKDLEFLGATLWSIAFNGKYIARRYGESSHYIDCWRILTGISVGVDIVSLPLSVNELKSSMEWVLKSLSDYFSIYSDTIGALHVFFPEEPNFQFMKRSHSHHAMLLSTHQLRGVTHFVATDMQHPSEELPCLSKAMTA